MKSSFSILASIVLVAVVAVHVCLAAPTNEIRKKIFLETRYDFIVVGSDHVARSIGQYLAKSHRSKSVLVLQSNRCDQILEPARVPNALGLRISDSFAGCAHLMGFEFTDPLRHGQKVGIGYKNRTRGLDTGQQTLWAIDPNLVLLSGATVVRLLYNHAAASVHGVELNLDDSKQCIFAENEVLIASRCLNDYRYLSSASIATEATLEKCLRTVPLYVALSSPVMAPMFYIKTNVTLAENPTLLGTELYLRTPECEDEDRMKPNTRLRIVMGNANLDGHIWVGLVPSLIWEDPFHSPDHEETVKMLTYVLKTAGAIMECNLFKNLNMTAINQSLTDCRKYEGTEHYWTCFLDVKLRRFYSQRTIDNLRLFQNDCHINDVKALRLLPFGLTEPFLSHVWSKLFSKYKNDQSINSIRKNRE